MANNDQGPEDHFEGFLPKMNFPELGATFTPGGSDDFYMPEVISPSPQRLMPEVPENMQDKMAHLELEADGTRNSVEPHAGHLPGRGDSLNTASSQPSIRLVPQASQQSSYFPPGSENVKHAPPSHGYTGSDGGSITYNILDQPSFSPFPRFPNLPPNVPPSDEEKEAMLEEARIKVLNSGDPEMQLAWAQDVLAYVEVTMQLEVRLSKSQSSRPQTPQVEHQLRVDAVNIVLFLAEQHHPRAEFMKGMWLEFGKFDYRIDRKEAFRCYARSADRGYPRAEYRMGMQFEASNDPLKAIQHYKRGVAMGDSASDYRLGMMILLGQHGQPQDFKRGLDHIRYAAETADEISPQGAYIYGMLLARELDNVAVPEHFLPYDVNEARVNIEKAAYLGFAKAQVKMGAAYELCQLGCDFNPALSLHYNALAARQGEAEAEMAVSKWFLCGYDGVFEKNEELAFTFAQRAARSELPTAEFAMGYFYEIGMFVPQNVVEARRWYELAAGHGNKDAVGRIEGISRKKTLSRKDHDQVAIQRIKSQYGSQRGKRPARFQTAHEPMPSIPDGRLAMPEIPIVRQPTGGNHLLQSSGALPPRSQSAAPYPLQDGPPLNAIRPGTAADFVNPAVRSRSAFGLNPNIRPATANTAGSRPQHASPSHSRPNVVPVSGQDNFGRIGRPRTSSSNVQGRTSPTRANVNTTPKPFSPRLDIGFSAPPDPAAERRNRLHKPQTQVSGKPNPPVSQFEHESSPNPNANRRPRTSPPPPPPSQGYEPQMRPATAQPPNRHTPSTRPYRARVGSLDGSPTSPTGSQRPQKPAIHPDAVAPRPPGKGPKTFEEMGVPQPVKESECVFECYLRKSWTDLVWYRKLALVM
ncbi:MAG: hypothetical protein M1816_003815 [Peltula sp. TS41687]|nr:MAG: hypothetical protein M1816_003815 [Peltula sp. TS41687]